MKHFLWIWGIFFFWSNRLKSLRLSSKKWKIPPLFGASLSLRKAIFTHTVLDSEPVTLSSQPHSSWLMSRQWFCTGIPSTTPHLPSLCLLDGGGKLTKLTLFFPACGCQVGQFLVFLRQMEFAVIKARSLSEALLGQTPVGGQHRISVELEVLKLGGERKILSVKLAAIFFLLHAQTLMTASLGTAVQQHGCTQQQRTCAMTQLRLKIHCGVCKPSKCEVQTFCCNHTALTKY